jgi:hypothetical protein
MNVDLDLTTRDLELQANQLYAIRRSFSVALSPPVASGRKLTSLKLAPARELEARY